MSASNIDIIPAASFASMPLQLVQPSLALSPWVQCIWHSETSNSITGYIEEKFYPDAGASLTFDIHNGRVSARYLHHARVCTERWDPAHAYISIRFHPGAAKKLLGLEVQSANNLEIDLLCNVTDAPKGIVEVADRLPGLLGLAQVALIEHWLMGLIPAVSAADAKLSGLIQFAAQTLLPPQQLTDHVGCSRRTLERKVRKQFGFSPNQLHVFAQIYRARKLLINSPQSLGDIALQCGYFDQSHFANAFREHTFETPKQYRQRKLSQFSNTA